MSVSSGWLGSLAVLAMLLAAGARADPWLQPGDPGLRSDIELLSDAGILRGPVTTWPLSWPDIARDALATDGRGLDAATLDALYRVQRLGRAAAYAGYSGVAVHARVAKDPIELRSFEDTPREAAEIGVRASWLTDHFALNLQGAYVSSPADGQSFRPDGSYAGVNFGNFMVSAGYMERFWGPGWDGSLILSTNARPIPTLTLERNYTDPFKTRLLSWLGPWRASIAIGETESDDVAVSNVRFLAMRVNFKPRPWLEFGLTRTAQWCGGDRPCDFKTFTDMLLGHDNQTAADGSVSVEQPGNQMAGYDARVRSPWRRLPLVFYTQWIGEDEAGGLPAKFLGLAGLETWLSTPMGGVRVRAEYTDTACNFTRQRPTFGCAYRSAIYPQGYTYRGRIIGEAMDGDGRMMTLEGILTRQNGDVMSARVSTVKLNRSRSAVNAWIPNETLDVDNVELRYSRGVGGGRLSLGLGYEDPALTEKPSQRIHYFATWQQGLR